MNDCRDFEVLTHSIGLAVLLFSLARVILAGLACQCPVVCVINSVSLNDYSGSTTLLFIPIQDEEIFFYYCFPACSDCGDETLHARSS